MRKSFDSLAEIVRESLGYEPRSGHLFVFKNKREDCMKVLYWNGKGYTIWYTRLERGKFQLPSAQVASIEISTQAFSTLCEGFDPKKVRRQRQITKEVVSV